ncbi:1-acyl-sn-glycerol-3-phosphate acyltransferase [Zhouia sp. PK063]|uniref:1-acyl-sn-glycerol-3-phosphate acyltransferase n=1 Tax=Zhouia sp. PK063 TaxID=3373602 RepID=UPI00378BA673
MSKFDYIRPLHDEEVQPTLQEMKDHPMVKAMLHFSFPDKSPEEIFGILNSCNSIFDFQSKVIYNTVHEVLSRTSEAFIQEGFEKLEPNTPYLFISNHRDIILDTSILNVALYEHNLIMTASAIGDNLVQKTFLMALAKLNRSFLIQRGQTPREMLLSSKLVSEFIQDAIANRNRSIWIAQREGRTKNGDDKTQQGVLKMLGLASDEEHLMDYFKKLKVVPVAISYEYDPTDILKMPELIAKHYDQEYKKTSNEDFNSILKGAVGQKKRIQISVAGVLDAELDDIKNSGESANKQYQMLGDLIDEKIYQHYKLWPTNYMAYDLLHGTNTFEAFYNDKEKRQFDRRIERRVEKDNEVALHNFLLMYANPVVNKLKLDE